MPRARPKSNVVDGFLIGDAALHAKLSTAMLDYLSRRKILIPSKPGSRGRGRLRRYSFGDLVMLRGLARLLKAGVSVSRIGNALEVLRDYQREIVPERIPYECLLTDGTRIYLQKVSRGPSDEPLLSLDGTGQMAFFFVMELKDLHTEVLASIAKHG